MVESDEGMDEDEVEFDIGWDMINSIQKISNEIEAGDDYMRCLGFHLAEWISEGFYKAFGVEK